MQNNKTIRIMLTDDHPMMLWGLSKLIEGEYPRMEVVATATCCDEALTKAAATAPDVIVLDLDLGGENSIDILPRLMSAGQSRVLILTAGRDQATLDLAVLQGARGVMSKDAPAEQVLKAIEKLHEGELWLDREAMGRVLSGLMRPAEASKPDPELLKQQSLTAKERKIVQTIMAHGGLLHKALAQRLFISEHTLRNHLTSIYQKLGVANQLELYVYAMKHQAALSAEADAERTPATGLEMPKEGIRALSERARPRARRILASARNPETSTTTRVV